MSALNFSYSVPRLNTDGSSAEGHTYYQMSSTCLESSKRFGKLCISSSRIRLDIFYWTFFALNFISGNTRSNVHWELTCHPGMLIIPDAPHTTTEHLRSSLQQCGHCQQKPTAAFNDIISGLVPRYSAALHSVPHTPRNQHTRRRTEAATTGVQRIPYLARICRVLVGESSRPHS